MFENGKCQLDFFFSPPGKGTPYSVCSSILFSIL